MTPSSQLPEAFVARLARIVGDDTAAATIATMAAPKRAAYWLNPLLEREPGVPVEGRLVVGFDDLFSVAAEDRNTLTRSPAAESGRLYVQNPASVYAARTLGAKPGEEILDLCAAPGGKTLVLAADMDNRGRLAVVEPVKGRFHRLRANLERCGITIAATYLKDGRRVGRATPGRFDRVLVDAPCFSEGRFRTADASSFSQWSPRKIKECARKQKGLLRSAFAALKPGGVLVYCTCTFAPEENEAVVDGLLGAEPSADVEVLPEPSCSWLPGLTAWQGREFDVRLGNARRLLPDTVWDAFFVCRIRRSR
jgi:16S rRNA (cytosine1407-C5)-methyltransferase